MSRAIVRLSTLALLAACGGGKPLFNTQVYPAEAVPGDVFACTRANLDSLKFRSVVLDINERRVSGRHVRKDLKDPIMTFYQAYDQIDTHVKSPKAGGTDTLTMVGHTIFEYRTAAGPWTVEHEASDSVVADMARLGERCAPTS